MPEKIHSAAHLGLGQAVRDLREKRKLSQAALAKEVGIDPSYLSGLERGRRNPTWTVIIALAKALKTTPAKLVARAERSGSTQRAS